MLKGGLTYVSFFTLKLKLNDHSQSLLALCLRLLLHLFFVCTNGENSGWTANVHHLIWTFAILMYDKHPFCMLQLTLSIIYNYKCRCLHKEYRFTWEILGIIKKYFFLYIFLLSNVFLGAQDALRLLTGF